MAKIDKKIREYCSNLPWGEDNPDVLGSVVMNHVWERESFYQRWCQKWFENFQFVYGNHDVKWIRSFGFAVDVDFLNKKRGRSSHKSKTNITRLVAESISSSIYARQPKWDVSPASESARQSKNISQLVQHSLDYWMIALNGSDRFSQWAVDYTVYGKSAAVIRYNDNAGIIKWVPKFRRVKVPVMTTVMKEDPILGGIIEVEEQAINSVGEPMFSESWQPVTDNRGDLAREPKPQGSPEIILLTPFEYQYEEGKDIHDAKWIRWIRLIDFDDYVREYDSTPGKTKYYEQVVPEMSSSIVRNYAIRHFFRMHFVSPDYDNKPVDMSTSGSYLKNKVLVIEHYDKPDPKSWPFGRRLIIANGQCTHVSQPQYSTNKVGGWHPFVEANAFRVSPSVMPSGALNDVVQKNKELNVADSLILTALHRDMGSALLVKTGSGIDPDRWTGTPGDIHECSDINGARWLNNEQPISPAVPALRQAIKDDVFEQSGAQDSLRGERSKGVSAGYALRQLQEREEKRIAPIRLKFENAVAEVGEKVIACFRENVQEVGEDMMGYLKRCAAGEFLPDEAVSFLTRDLELGVDIKVEAGSMQVESKATQQFNILDLVQKTAFGQRLATDVKVQDDVLKAFGAESLRGFAGAHRDRAANENELFTDMLRLGPDRIGQTQPTVIFEDDDSIHIAEHTDFIIRNATEIMSNSTVMLPILTHIEEHRIQNKSKQGEAPPEAKNLVRAAQGAARQRPTDPSAIQAQVQQAKLAPPPPTSPASGAGGGAAPQQPPKEAGAPPPAGGQQQNG
jgi:hypothetical protein